MTSSPLPRSATAALLAALLCAGCGGADDPETGTATAGAARSKAVRFAECMRDNGISGFPDPAGSEPVTLDGLVNGSSLDLESPAWDRAVAACRRLQPAGFTGRERTADEQDGALAFARCIREHGVEDFPDPVPDQPLVDTRRIPSTDRPGGMDALDAAMEMCRDPAEAAGVRP